MRELADTYNKTGTLHHAYCIEGDTEASVSALADFLNEALGMNMRGNPDVWHAVFETFGIDESRELIERQSRKAISGGKKIFIIGTASITREAQNALLKVFEEPQGDAHFFLCVPSVEVLLPTLRSRMLVLSRDSSTEKKRNEHGAGGRINPEAFLATPLPERLALLKGTVDSKDKSQAMEFLNTLESALYVSPGAVENRPVAAFEEIMLCRGYLRDSASSPKMLLEHLALTLPIVP